MSYYNEVDQYILEEAILNLLIKTNQKKDRTYIDTIKRILEGNERSKIAEKYKEEPFYRRFPRINRSFIGKTLKKLLQENKIIAYKGKNDLLYYGINMNKLSEIEENQTKKLAELLAKELI